ncbi:MAG: Fatty acid desaturase [Bryobacterales bacterium]|nr:Fatty acid desaturase [Bryobacterales bacterium]
MKTHSDAWSLVKDLHQPRPAIFWADLLFSAMAGWGGFGVALLAKPFSASMWLGFLIATCALYRGLCFVHEISHIRRSHLRGFETVWNAIFGIPLLMPSFVYVGVHSNHHSLATYGTDQDPEYLPFAKSHWMTVVFAAHSVLIPLALLLRFLILAPIGLLWPNLHRWLVVHASSLSMNTLYRREETPSLTSWMRRWEMAILVVWLAAATIAWHYGLGWKALAVWSGISACAALCNALRALGAHRYESTGTPLDREGQLLDSIDTPGALWTELWAPVGLRYHALHHYFPGIPYHNLGTAYARLVSSLSPEAGYQELTSPSLPWSLRRLYRCGKSGQQSGRSAKLCAQPPVRSTGN